MGVNTNHALIEEPLPLRRERRGGAVNLWLAGLLLEAARMLDEGIDPDAVESASRKTFGIGKGLLERISELGAGRLADHLAFLSRRDGPDDPLHRLYDNFFSSPAILLQPERFSRPPAADPGGDWILEDHLVKRFQAVAFMIAAEVVGSGLLGIGEMDREAARVLGAGQGPFGMMNDLGPRESLGVVTERMEMSHRKEINFPIPRLLIEQAGRDTPWTIA